MSNEIILGIRIDADGKDAAAEVKTTTGEIDKLGKSTRAASSEAERLNQSSQNLAQGFRMATIAGAGLIGLNLGAGLARDIVHAADAMTNLESRLSLVTSGYIQLQTAKQSVIDIAQATRQAVDSTGDLYTKLAKGGEQLNLSQQQVASLTATVSRAVALSGSTAESSRAAIMQFGQALASGVLRGEELNSIMEQTPALAEAIAKGMGKSTGELRAMGEAGQLTVQQIVSALNNQAPQIEAQFNQLTPTVGGAFQQLSNSGLVFVGRLDQATGASHILAGTIKLVADNIDGVAVASVSLLSVSLASLVGRKVEAALAARALAAQESTLAASTTSLNAALGMKTAQVGTATIAMRGASGVIAALGGPIGILISVLSLGATAWAVFGSSAESAAERAAKAGRGIAEEAAKTGKAELEIARAKRDQAADQYFGGDMKDRKLRDEYNQLDALVSQLETREKNIAERMNSASFGEKWSDAFQTQVEKKKKSLSELDALYVAETQKFAGNEEKQIQLAQQYMAKRAQLETQFNKQGQAAAKANESAYESAVKAAEKYVETLNRESDQLGLTDVQKKMVEASTVALTLRTEKERTAVMAAAASWARKKIDLEQAGEAAKKNNEEFDEFFAASEAERLANENGIKGLREKIEAIEEETLVMTLNAEQLREHQVLRALEKSGLEATSAEYLELKQRMEEAYTSNDYARAAKSTADEWKTLWSTVEQTGKSVFVGILSEGKGAFEGIGKAIKASVIDLLYQVTAKKWLISIGTSLGVPGLANAAGGAAGGAGGAGTSILGSMGSSIAGSSMMQGLISGGGFLGQLSGGVAGAMQGGIINGFTSGMSMIGLEGGFASGLGLMLPGLGIALAGLALFAGDLFDGGGPKIGAASYQDQNGNIRAGEYNGETFNRTSSGGDPFKIQDMTSALIGDLAGVAKTFGTSLGEEFRYGLQAEFDPEGDAPGTVGYMVNGTTVQRQVDGQDPEAGARELALIAQQSMVAALQEIDLSPVVDPLLDSLTDVGSMTEQQVKETLATISTLSEMSVSSVEKIFGEAFDVSKFAALSVGGENTVQTFARLAGEFQATNAVADMLGQDVSTAFGAVGLASAEMRQSLIDGAGGLEKFTAQAQGYYNAFFTDAEKQAKIAANATAELEATFGSLGVAIPETHQEFNALLSSLDFSTEAGQSTYQMLMDVTDAFVALHGTAQDAAAATEQAAAATVTLTESLGNTFAGLPGMYLTSVGEVFDAAHAKIDEVSGWAAQLSGETPGSNFSDSVAAQIAAISKLMDDAASQLTEGTWSGAPRGEGSVFTANPNYNPYLSQAQKQELEELSRYGQAQIEQLTAQLALYTQFESEYSGKGEQLLELQNWYTAQQALMAGHTDILSQLEKTYQAKRLEIINGGNTSATGALSGWAERLRTWLDGLAFNNQLSPLTAQQQFEEARTQYLENLALANTGDQEAMAAYQNFAQEYLSQAKNMWGFGGEYSAIWQSIQETGSGFLPPELVDPNDKTVVAIEDLRDELAAVKAVLARVMERGNADAVEQRNAIVAAILDSGNKQARALETAAAVKERV